MTNLNLFDQRDAIPKCCGDQAPDRSTRSCDLPRGHDGDHWTYQGRMLKWPQVQRDAVLERVQAHTEQHTPGFAVAAEAFVLGYLAREGPSSGELVTNACKAAGIVPHDDRAFGPVYMRLSRAQRIVKVGQCPRLKGHLTGGANVWALPT